jgi:murein DD-endopeptidase / murein LD-carboxypeptidase
VPGALEDGANCQRFAYELLRANGRAIGDLRSSDLWADTRDTMCVTDLEPLDLLLFNRTPDAWGAHVALYLGDERAVHLSKQVGRPVIWTLEQFTAEPRYRCFIGAKRSTTRLGEAAALHQPPSWADRDRP